MQQDAAVLAYPGSTTPSGRARAQALVDRCENWADCYRDRMRQGRAQSFEGNSRSTRGNEKEWSIRCPISGKWLGFGSTSSRPARDWLDADEINGAWQSIPDSFHQAVLGAHYVRKWAPPTCVRIGRELSGEPHKRRDVSDKEFQAIIGMAHALLTDQLNLPAVFRRDRLALRVRLGLELDEWRRAEATMGAG